VMSCRVSASSMASAVSMQVLGMAVSSRWAVAHDVAGAGRCCADLGLGLGEDAGGKGELGDLVAEVADFPAA
jgi:hypothetical protein